MFEVDDRDSIVRLRPHAVCVIVNQDHLRKGNALEDGQVLDQFFVPRAATRVPVENFRDKLTVGVDDLENSVSVVFHRSSKDHDFEMVAHYFQEAVGVRPNVHVAC